MALRVHVPVGGGYGAARQVVRAGVPDFMAEDMINCDFEWARANSFMILQADGMSRICSLCGSFQNRKTHMATAHEEGGKNSRNKTIVLAHLVSSGHRARVATKRADAAAAARSQSDTIISQSGEGIVYSLPTAPLTSPAPSALSQAPLRGTFMHHSIVQHATPLPHVTQHTTPHAPMW